MTARQHLDAIIDAYCNDNDAKAIKLIEEANAALKYDEDLSELSEIHFHGKMITAGNLIVNGERFDGVAIEIPREILRDMKLPLYQNLTYTIGKPPTTTRP